MAVGKRDSKNYIEYFCVSLCRFYYFPLHLAFLTFCIYPAHIFDNGLVLQTMDWVFPIKVKETHLFLDDKVKSFCVC